jgi:hypothetical protein
LSGGVISADANLAEDTISVRFAGTADVEARAELDGFVKKLHTESVRLGVKNVAIDFRELGFMNSSCFKIFVTWLAQLGELAKDQQYKIQIRSDPNLLWQRRSLAALSCFAVDLVTIQT